MSLESFRLVSILIFLTWTSLTGGGGKSWAREQLLKPRKWVNLNFNSFFLFLSPSLWCSPRETMSRPNRRMSSSPPITNLVATARVSWIKVKTQIKYFLFSFFPGKLLNYWMTRTVTTTAYSYTVCVVILFRFIFVKRVNYIALFYAIVPNCSGY